MRRFSIGLPVFLLSLSLSLGACVPKGKYDEALQDAANLRAAAIRKTGDDAKEIARLQAVIADLQQQTQDRDKKISDLTTDNHNVQQKLDEATALTQRLASELKKTGADVDKILQDKASLSKSLEDMKAQLEQLRKAQAAADARAALFQSFINKFKALTEAGQLRVVTRRGRLVLQLPNEVLFDPGQAVVKPQGKATLQEIGKVLGTMKDRQFQVSGHTDNNPIRTARYPSNWDLSTDRAIQVVKILLDAGVPPTILSAAGYGEWDPVAPNTAPDGQSKNRRIEITLQPNIEELLGATPS